MIASVWIIVAAAVSSHAVQGAFDYSLGAKFQDPSSKCVGSSPEHGRVVYRCPGDDFFDRVLVHTDANIVTWISPQKIYSSPDISLASQCMRDSMDLLKVIEGKYPSLKLALPMTPNTWERSEVLYRGYGYGRGISGECSVPVGEPQLSFLTLTYRLSHDEQNKIERLSKAKKLQERGLTPNRL